MDFEELKNKARSLPLLPGVYIMKDREDTVIYVGKAKKLKNRVSQYFQETSHHNQKTRKMVSNIHHFDVIVAASEFEALVLECSLIKRHQPRYNILLKDDKGYPYVRLDVKREYPTIEMVNKPANDGAVYYGPFGSRGVTQNILDAVRAALKLPSCARRFPQDIGKGRPCLHFHMDQCAGWCRDPGLSRVYNERIEQAKRLFQGDFKTVSGEIRNQMLSAANDLNFELAANLRDRLNAVENLSKKQLVTAGISADTDAIGYAESGTKACLSILHYRGGDLMDKEYEIFSLPDDRSQALSSLIKQYYLNCGFTPKVILLPFGMEDSMLFEQMLVQNYKKNVKIRVPQRGNSAYLVELANKNAQEEVNRITDKNERTNATLSQLIKMLGLDTVHRIESYDISNISGTDIVASMVVFQDGRPHRSSYKHFKVRDLSQQDDYASMAEVLKRRFSNYINQERGFEERPDLLLIDGGITHALTALKVLESMDLHIPVFGMVKDDRHRTRALVTPEGMEIRIDNQQSVFSLIGNIQEETHRFAITYHRKLRSKRLRYSELDGIAGVGTIRKQQLLKNYKSITAIAGAELSELERHLPKNVALAVYEHFRQKG